ncbi:MAG: ATP-binding protein [Acidobacteriota bacterium]
MRLTIKVKQVLGVVSTVGLATGVITGFYVSSLVHNSLAESRGRGELLANAIFHRASALVAGPDLSAALQGDEGLRSLLESSAAYSGNVVYAAIADIHGVAIVHNDLERAGQSMPTTGDMDDLLKRGTIGQLLAIYSDSAKTLEVREPLVLGTTAFGSIRIGVSTLLIRRELAPALQTALLMLVATLAASTVVATLLAQLLLRPIHVLRHRLARLGENDFGVTDDLPRDEFGELGDSLAAVSARLLADRTGLSMEHASPETPGWLEDAVAVFNANGEVLLANTRMQSLLPDHPGGKSVSELLTAAHPYRRLVEESLADRRSHGPLVIRVPDEGHSRPAERGPAGASEQLVRSDVIDGVGGGQFAVMVVARDLEHLRHMQSTLSYARRVATLGRLSAGLAHEIKNPLHATMIRLELLKQLLADREPHDTPPLLEHVAVVGAQMRRLDEVVQSFLKFIRPEELQLRPVQLSTILEAIMPIVEAEARSHGVTVLTECSNDLPPLSADSPVLEQAFMNLAINACQATPSGGSLRIAAAAARDRRIEVVFEDTGVGISPEHLEKIFDLYFTTKEHGSGIGLAMVFRAVHLHNGEIEVQSTPGRGTTFRLLLPQA